MSHIYIIIRPLIFYYSTTPRRLYIVIVPGRWRTWFLVVTVTGFIVLHRRLYLLSAHQPRVSSHIWSLHTNEWSIIYFINIIHISFSHKFNKFNTSWLHFSVLCVLHEFINKLPLFENIFWYKLRSKKKQNTPYIQADKTCLEGKIIIWAQNFVVTENEKKYLKNKSTLHI